jgi:hypothetical protein
VTLKVSTYHKGGFTIRKHATLFTNDKKYPRLKLTISGRVDKFVTIRPKRVKLRGVAGEAIKRKVTITPEKKYPFKIVNVSAKYGKDIHYELSEEKSEKGPVYALLIENKRLEKGRYFDMITLETDSHIQPKLSIRVYGDLRQPAAEKKEQTQ